MPSCNTYHLTWVSLTLGVGYLFMAAPASRSHCSLPWMRGVSSLPPFLTFNVDGSSRPFCAQAATVLPLVLGVGLLLPDAAPGLGCGVTPKKRCPFHYTGLECKSMKSRNTWKGKIGKLNRSVVSDSLRPHESQHARPSHPSPTPRVHSNSCP